MRNTALATHSIPVRTPTQPPTRQTVPAYISGTPRPITRPPTTTSGTPSRCSVSGLPGFLGAATAGPRKSPAAGRFPESSTFTLAFPGRRSTVPTPSPAALIQFSALDRMQAAHQVTAVAALCFRQPILAGSSLTTEAAQRSTERCSSRRQQSFPEHFSTVCSPIQIPLNVQAASRVLDLCQP